MDITGIITSFELKTAGLFLLFIISSASLFFTVNAFLTDTTHKHKIAFVSGSLILWTLAVVSGWRMVMQLVAVPSIAKDTSVVDAVVSPQMPAITYTFKAPVDFATMIVHTYPPIDLDIKPHGYFGNRVSIGRRLTLSSKTTLPPGERYMVYLSNIEGPFTRGYGGEYLLKLQTSTMDIVEVTPADTETTITPKQTFMVKLSEPIFTVKEWSVRSTPEHPFTIELRDPRTLAITPQTPLSQAAQYAVTIFHTPIVYRLDNNEKIQTLKPKIKRILRFTTVQPALLTSIEPQGSGINPETDVRIIFDESMDRQSTIEHLTITGEIEFTPLWDSQGKILTLKHKSFTKDTDYILVIKKGVKTAAGGMMEADITTQFRTAGPVVVTQMDPLNSATDVSNTQPVTLTFDQPVPRNIVNYITFTPAITATVSAAGRTVTFFPSTPLVYETNYSVTVKTGAPSIYGLPSSYDQIFSFTITPPALTVPYFEQEAPFTCNMAAVRMLLAYRGVEVTEQKLIDVIGLGGKRGSGNPYKGYIDDYGTYWDAVARGVDKYRPTRIIKGGKLADIITEIKKGNPVMTWGQNGWSDPYDISWTATDGTFIKAINGMHSAVVRGYTGSDSNPTELLLNDPWRGQYALDTKEFMRRWGYFGVAMVVD